MAALPQPQITMDIRTFQPADAAAVHRLLAANGWQHRIPSTGHLLALVAASQRAMVVVKDDQLVGFARAITDGLSNGYLSMVVVAEHCRGQGIGSRLIERMLDDGENMTWVLRAARPGAREFFSKLGFSPSVEAMERVRRTAEK